MLPIDEEEKNGKKGMKGIKMDVENAYGRVEWKFLEGIL